jgi:hypothetical protein
MKVETQLWKWDDKQYNSTGYHLGQKIDKTDQSIYSCNDHTYKLKDFNNISLQHDNELIIKQIVYFDDFPIIDNERPKSFTKKDIIEFVEKYLVKVEDEFHGDILHLIFRDELLSSSFIVRLHKKINPKKIKVIRYT